LPTSEFFSFRSFTPDAFRPDTGIEAPLVLSEGHPDKFTLARNRLLRLAASAEQASEHPLAAAVLQAAHNKCIRLYPLVEGHYAVHAGCGVECLTPEGKVVVGNRSFVESQGLTVGTYVDSAMWDLEVQGKTAVCVVLDSCIVGILGIADTPKPEAFSTISALRSMGIDVWMVTGDNRTTAEAVADDLDIPKVS
jgi:Cu+-exporting ATPase